RGQVCGLRLIRTPVVMIRRAKQARLEYDVPAMFDALATAIMVEGDEVDVEIVLEEQQAMPASLRGRKQGGRSTFRTGLGYGLWLGLVVAAGVRYTTIRPAAWKKAHGLLGADKKASRLRCAQRFPALGAIRAADEGPAEALLMAAAIQ